MQQSAVGDGSNSQVTIAAFPNEVFESIFEHLSPVELSRLSQTSRSLCQIATSSILWESSYFSFWREGKPEREKQRGTTEWRMQRRYAELRDAARQAWLIDGRVEAGGDNYSKRRRKEISSIGTTEPTPFPLYLSSECAESDGPSSSPHFYRLFLERIRIDNEVLQVINSQCCSSNRWMERVKRLIEEHGNDCKDVLHALINCQTRKGDEILSTYDDESDISEHTICPTALQVRLPTTTRSPTHHLTLLHYARELLEHLQCREALKGFVSLRSGSPLETVTSQWLDIRATNREEENMEGLTAARISKSFECAIAFLSMFRGGEAQEITEEIDVLSVSCSLYLASYGISLDSDRRKLASGIYQFMHKRGFKGASPAEYENLDNNFIHLCLDESGRETLPLSLTVLYSSIACRLGLPAFPTNTPARVLIVVESPSDSIDSSASSDRFWIDVYGDGKILNAEDVRVMLASMRFPMQGDFIGPGTATSVCLRASRNIIRSVQGAQGAPQFDAQAQNDNDDADINMDMEKANLSTDGSQSATDVFERLMMSFSSLYNPRRTYLTINGHFLVSPFWSADRGTLLKRRHRRASNWSYSDQQSAMHAASNALTRLGDELGDRGSDWCAALAQTYFQLDALIMQDEFTNQTSGSPLYVEDVRSRFSLITMFQGLVNEDQNGPIPVYRTWPDHSSIYKVGTLFLHRVYGYKAAIVGWNDHCNSPDSWILNMGVDQLPNGGRNQPFYQSIHEDGSTRYVAHCNIIPARQYSSSSRNRNLNGNSISLVDAEEVLQQRGIGKLFRCLSRQGDNLRLIKNQAGIQAFPDD